LLLPFCCVYWYLLRSQNNQLGLQIKYALLMAEMGIVKTGVARRKMYFTRSEKYKTPVSCSFVSLLQDPHHDTEPVSNYLVLSFCEFFNFVNLL